jgi:hypothetical protein
VIPLRQGPTFFAFRAGPVKKALASLRASVSQTRCSAHACHGRECFANERE